MTSRVNEVVELVPAKKDVFHIRVDSTEATPLRLTGGSHKLVSACYGRPWKGNGRSSDPSAPSALHICLQDANHPTQA